MMAEILPNALFHIIRHENLTFSQIFDDLLHFERFSANRLNNEIADSQISLSQIDELDKSPERVAENYFFVINTIGLVKKLNHFIVKSLLKYPEDARKLYQYLRNKKSSLSQNPVWNLYSDYKNDLEISLSQKILELEKEFNEIATQTFRMIFGKRTKRIIFDSFLDLHLGIKCLGKFETNISIKDKAIEYLTKVFNNQTQDNSQWESFINVIIFLEISYFFSIYN